MKDSYQHNQLNCLHKRLNSNQDYLTSLFHSKSHFETVLPATASSTEIMKSISLSLTTTVLATLATHATADFLIYYELAAEVMQQGSGTGSDMSNNEYIRLFKGKPDCNNDVLKGWHLNIGGDVSEANGARCDGCGESTSNIDKWSINNLEVNHKDYEHFTIYKSNGYAIRPKDDDAADLGKCKRITNGDTYNCATLGNGFKGYPIFECKSKMSGKKLKVKRAFAA